jgi:hypothetical protein
MDDAISEFVEGDKKLPGRGERERKALLAERMGLSKTTTAFSTAWDQRKDSKFRLAKQGTGFCQAGGGGFRCLHRLDVQGAFF